MTWLVQSWWGTNTTSRNAFYQAFFIRREDLTAGVAALHYGKLTPELKRSKRPVLGGSLKFNNGWTLAMTASKVMEKKNRGYEFEKTTKPIGMTEDVLRRYLNEVFGASHRDTILIGLGLKAGDTMGEIPMTVEHDSVPMPAFDDSTRPETWGSW